MPSPEQRRNDRTLPAKLVLVSLTIVVLGLPSGCVVGGGGSGSSGGSGTGGDASIRIFSPERSSEDSALELVDLSLIYFRNGSGFPAIDVKLRNKGNAAAFLKRAELRIHDQAEFYDCSMHMVVLVNWTYDLNLDNPKPFAISQSVPAKSVDRFAIGLGHTLKDPFDKYRLYRMQLVITFDEDDKLLESRDFVVLLSAMGDSVLDTFVPDCPKNREEDVTRASSWPVSYSLPNYFKASQQPTELEGKDKSWFEKNWGQPDGKASRFFGGETWTYYRSAGGKSGPPLLTFKPDQCQITLKFDKEEKLSDHTYSGC